MKKISVSPFCILAAVSAAFFPMKTNARPATDNPNLLWYDKPAEKWEQALPVGNGRLGAMIFGE